MIVNAGYKFTAKHWMAAFLVNTFYAVAASTDGSLSAQPPHYLLLDLPTVKQKEESALEAGNLALYTAYKQARVALQETEEGLRATPYDLPGDFEKNQYVLDNQGAEYHLINPDGDVDWTTYYLAQKSAQVIAVKVGPGTVVQTVLANGVVETIKKAGPNGGYDVTNPTGEHYLVDTAKFENIYEPAEAPGVYKPKPDPRKVLGINENVAFKAPWGEMMYIRAGGVLVHEALGKVYGIQPDEYAKTYSPI